ncbi:MAG: CHASE1-domain containing sensor protein [Gammaproteobacteria bacterium]|jgi:CHASE1-domain containing sensor protein
MLKYEDALWGGVDAIAAAKGTNSEFNEHNWRAFSGTLQIGKKSPGISGIGVIHRVEPGELASYLAQQRRTRAQFRVHPAHRQNEYMPITFIEPMAPNLKAVGLDMAHANNRYTAAKKARDSGLAQVTGPIVLVQGSAKTPGFLFYAPFYHSGPSATIEQRRQRFAGMVYAPFCGQKADARGLGPREPPRRHPDLRQR